MRYALTAIAVIVILALPADAELVYLKSGAVLDGRVLEDSEHGITLEVPREGGATLLSIPREHLLRVDTDADFQARLARAEALLRTSQYAQSEELLRELLRQQPQHAGARMGLARALIATRRSTEALRVLDAYLELVEHERNAALVLFTAEQYLEARDFRNARRLAREAASLPTADEELKSEADEFVRRIERVRSGAEQFQERTAAEQADRARLRAERANWNSDLGNSREAEDAGLMLAEWTADAQPRLLLSRHVEITAPTEAMNAYLAGGDARELRERVNRCNVKLRVDETIWLSLYDHQKAVFIYGWYYQLKDRFPRCSPAVTVVVETEERGRMVEKRVARGTWDGRRESVTIDRWTRENRDPNRPVRPVIR
jgi:tetratricopeptide (TPR) repeat protein